MPKPPEYENKIITGDCLKVLPSLPAACADLVFADPPFNIGYDYNGEYHDKRDSEEYISWCSEWIAACKRIMSQRGSLFIAIGDEYAAEIKILATKTLGLHLRNWIIWHYRFGQNTRTKFARAHAHIFYLVKTPDSFIFNADPVKVMSGRQKNYADKRAFHTLGKLPDDVWDEFPRVCGTFSEREGLHPCQMPEALLARIIRAASNRDSLVVDPFAGSGTTLAAAWKMGRKYLGIELSETYATQIEKRLDSIVADESDTDSSSLWSVLHLDELNSLYLETGVALDRLSHNDYLRKLFVEQFHVRIGQKNQYSEREVMGQLKSLRKTGKLSRTQVLDDGRSYRPPRGMAAAQGAFQASSDRLAI